MILSPPNPDNLVRFLRSYVRETQLNVWEYVTIRRIAASQINNHIVQIRWDRGCIHATGTSQWHVSFKRGFLCCFVLCFRV